MAEPVNGTRQIPAGTPVTDGKLFDALHEWFGIGLYDEDLRVESANQDDRWLTRLLRASPASREEVLKEWQEQHWKL
jgi:hypothetical protein